MPLRRTPLETVERVVGNLEAIPARLIDQSGSPVNLTGLTITWRLVNTQTHALEATGAATLVTPLNGEVKYMPVTADMDTAGNYAMYWITNETPARRFPYDGARHILNIKNEGDSD